jgi:hypothetical protein
MARPPIPFNQDVADRICEMLATTRFGLEDILAYVRVEIPETPGLSTIYKWLRDNEEFAKQSARARELQGDTIADLALNVAYEPLVGTITTTQEWGDQVKVADNVERSKLIVQTLMKRAGQLAPKKYGERLGLDHSGSIDVSLADRIAKARTRNSE